MSVSNIIDIIKASFGWGVLLLLGWLAWHILHGDVTQANSYGLDAIEGGLIAMAGGYTQWAFGHRIPVEHSQSVPPAPAVSPAPKS